MKTRTQYPGITYYPADGPFGPQAEGTPVFLTDAKAHAHLEKQGGKHCDPAVECRLCRYVEKSIARQRR